MISLSQYIQESKGNVNRLLGMHSKYGYIIISACRGSNSAAENKAATSELHRTLKDSKWSFTLTTGKYQEEGMPEPSIEKSFIVYCGKNDDFEELKKFGVELCKKYNQDTVLVTSPEDKIPTWYDKNGRATNRFTGPTYINHDKVVFKTQVGNSTITFNESLTDEAFTYLEDDLRDAIVYLAYKIKPNFFDQLRAGKWANVIGRNGIRIDWDNNTWQYRGMITPQLHKRIAEVMTNYELKEIDPVKPHENL